MGELIRIYAPASWSAAVRSAAFGFALEGWRGKAPERTGALQKLRQYRGACEPRASVMECGCPFCRFWFCTRRVEGKAPEKTGAVQKLRQYRGACEPRASVMECGCPFCRF